MGLAGYKGTKESNGTSYTPIARDEPEPLRTQNGGGGGGAMAAQKRNISVSGDVEDNISKKARLSSPERAESTKMDAAPPSQTHSVHPSPSPSAATAATAAATADKPVKSPEPEDEGGGAAEEKRQGLDGGEAADLPANHQETPASAQLQVPPSPQADTIVEAVDNKSITVQPSETELTPSVPATKIKEPSSGEAAGIADNKIVEEGSASTSNAAQVATPPTTTEAAPVVSESQVASTMTPTLTANDRRGSEPPQYQHETTTQPLATSTSAPTSPPRLAPLQDGSTKEPVAAPRAPDESVSSSQQPSQLSKDKSGSGPMDVDEPSSEAVVENSTKP